MTVNISEFEILFSGLIPGVPLPLVAQGYFLQVSNLTDSDQTVSLDFVETTQFANAQVVIDESLTLNLLMANYLDGSGNANPYPDFLTNSSPGFQNITIPSGETFVFGVQAFPTPAASLADTHPAKSRNPRLYVAPTTIPTFGIQWHGYVGLSCDGTFGSLCVNPTTRGVFFDPILETTTGQTDNVMTLGITTGQTYSSVTTFNGTAAVTLPA